jgi:hypothetical protein
MPEYNYLVERKNDVLTIAIYDYVTDEKLVTLEWTKEKGQWDNYKFINNGQKRSQESVNFRKQFFAVTPYTPKEVIDWLENKNSIRLVADSNGDLLVYYIISLLEPENYQTIESLIVP